MNAPSRSGDARLEVPLATARASGLLAGRAPVLVLLSGGADSVCLLDVAIRLGVDVHALHVNYGLREQAEEDEQHCRELCSGLGVSLTVEPVALPDAGNLQANAREARYLLAERLAAGDYAAAHTASDQAETVLYRLATSPGRRALMGMEPRRGRLVRPLLGATRDEVRAYCRARGLDWREDASNTDPRFARARVRTGLLTALRDVGPAAERTLAETALQLREEDEVLTAAGRDALVRLGGGPVIELSAFGELPEALGRIVLRALAEVAAGSPRPLTRADVAAVLALRDRGGSRSLDLGGGLRAVVEYGTLRFQAGREVATPAPVALAVPGRARFGDWLIEAGPGRAGEVTIARGALEGALTVRGWSDGDRIRPVGLGGTKTLQDLFTDRKVPRALRRSLPVVEADGEIVWVAGVAVAERFAASEHEPDPIALSARPVR